MPNEIKMDPILVDIPMPIRTPRLVIRNVMPGDGAAIHASKEETWDILKKWMPWTAHGTGSISETEKVARENYAKFILRTDMMMVAHTLAPTPEQELIACTGLHNLDWDVRSFSIGYWVRASAHNKGYATEIANALTRFAFGALNARRLIISAATENTASRRVIEKLGFGLESLSAYDSVLPDGSLSGTATYVRYNTDNLPPLDVTWGV